jgi:hypothetical protein
MATLMSPAAVKSKKSDYTTVQIYISLSIRKKGKRWNVFKKMFAWKDYY